MSCITSTTAQKKNNISPTSDACHDYAIRTRGSLLFANIVSENDLKEVVISVSRVCTSAWICSCASATVDDAFERGRGEVAAIGRDLGELVAMLRKNSERSLAAVACVVADRHNEGDSVWRVALDGVRSWGVPMSVATPPLPKRGLLGSGHCPHRSAGTRTSNARLGQDARIRSNLKFQRQNSNIGELFAGNVEESVGRHV